QPMCARQKLVVLTKELGRHAIRAAVIAAVDDRDAQISQRPHEPILDGCLRLPMSYGMGHLRGSATIVSGQSGCRISCRYSNLRVGNEQRGTWERGFGMGSQTPTT